jgi:ABC-type molybdate transport system substrate-binding protein
MIRPLILAAAVFAAASTLCAQQPLLPPLAATQAQPLPPWSAGHNNPATDRGFAFPVGDVDNTPDLHGNPADAQLVLFIGGNQFFVLPQLIARFEQLHPELRGHIFYETLPPGILRQQSAQNDTLTLGNLTLRVVPDVYEAGARVVDAMQAAGQVDHATRYATNNLAIMIPVGNPKGIHSLNDLARSDLRLSMPNPAWEGVARQIGTALRNVGGDSLYQSVYVAKVASGQTRLTQIHHRQTPMRILANQADAGVTWASEVAFQRSIGNPITGIAIPDSQNVTAIYAAAVLRNAPHRAAALAWLGFLQSPEAQAAYRSFGFQPYSVSLQPASSVKPIHSAEPAR